MDTKHNHHVLPKLYLKGFVFKKGEPYIWVYQRGQPYGWHPVYSPKSVYTVVEIVKDAPDSEPYLKINV